VIRDRGRIKWTSMMLPEHVKLLRDWKEEDQWESKVQLDEQKIEEMNRIMNIAMEYSYKINVTYYENKRHKHLAGKLDKYDVLTKMMIMMDEGGKKHHIPMSDIEDVQLIEE